MTKLSDLKMSCNKDYQNIISSMNKQQEYLKKKSEENMNTEKLAYEEIIEVMKRFKVRFDFSDAFQVQKRPQLTTQDYFIYKSANKGFKDVSVPPKYDFENPLTAIETNPNNTACEFNFIFKNGESTNLPFAECKQTVRIPVKMEKVARISINYNPEGCVHGIKMWSSEGEQLLQVGDFNYTNYDIRL